MIICFLGPEGSGKGTQAMQVAQKLQVPHVVTGDILRSRKDEQSEIGELIRKTFEAGSYLPDEAIIEIFLDRIKQPDCANGFVSDGYPRSVKQAEVLDEYLTSQGKHVDHVVLLNLSEEESIKRLMQRGRFDDTPDHIRGRLQTYHERADAMIQHYRNNGVLREINGDNSIEEVHASIIQALGIAE